MIDYLDNTERQITFLSTLHRNLIVKTAEVEV